MKFLSINRCPIHKNFWSVSIDDNDGGGVRLTPSKCCGQWKTENMFKMSKRDWEELSEQALIAAEEA